jgi:hypothetical protein
MFLHAVLPVVSVGVCSASLVLPTGMDMSGEWGKACSLLYTDKAKEWGTSQLTSLFLQIISVGYIAVWKYFRSLYIVMTQYLIVHILFLAYFRISLHSSAALVKSLSSFFLVEFCKLYYFVNVSFCPKCMFPCSFAASLFSSCFHSVSLCNRG